MFEQAQANTSIGTATIYDEDGSLLGEYDNGSANGKGSAEYIWLPTEDGSAIPVGMYRNGKLYAIHTDHLGTPRLVSDEAGQAVWQWPYSAFGHNSPSGVLQAGTSSAGQTPPLKATKPQVVLNLRYPGQYFDEESNLSYNYFRNYDARTGRYTQFDPIGLRGGWNGYAYVDNSPLTKTDPNGLQALPTPWGPMPAPVVPTPSAPSPGGYDPRTDTFTPGTSRPLPGWLNDFIDRCMESRGRGERGATGGSSGKGTDNPYKHCRNHPTDPKKILCKDHQTGKTVEKKKPADWPG